MTYREFVSIALVADPSLAKYDGAFFDEEEEALLEKMKGF